MKICDTIKKRFQTMKSKFKKGDPIYIKVNADAMKGQKLTVVSDKGKYVIATAKDGRDYEIDKSAIRTTAKPKAAANKPNVSPKSGDKASKPKSKATASKAKSKGKVSKPKSKATTSKPKAATKATVCLPLFDKGYKKLSSEKYKQLKKANKKNIEAGKITLRELQSRADKSAYKEYFGK